MKNVMLIVLLGILLTFTSCDPTGRSINVLPGGAGIYIDDVSDADGDGLGRYDSYEPNFQDVLITLEVIAANFNNITGFEFDMAYDPTMVEFSSAIHGGVFGSIPGSENEPNGDYFCVNEVDQSGVVNNIACAALPTGNYYPVFGSNLENGYGYLQTIQFNPISPGWTTFSINTGDEINTILAYGNGSQLNLVSAYQEREVLICQSEDGDDFFNTAECNDGVVVDCDDNNEYAYPGRSEACNAVDLNCDGSAIAGASCSAYTPTITSVTANTQQLPSDQTFSGMINLVVVVNDISLPDDVPEGDILTDPLGSNMDFVSVSIDGNEPLVDSTNNAVQYTLNINSHSLTNGIHTLEIVAQDQLGLSHTITREIEIDNTGSCDIVSLSWDLDAVQEGSVVGISVFGTPDCANRGMPIIYEECDNGVCTANIPSEIIDSLPNQVIFGSSSTVNMNALINWFLDEGDDTTDPEIRMVIEGSSNTAYSGELLILNNPPTLEVTGVTPQQLSATISFSVDEQSDVVLSYGVTQDYGITDTITTNSGGSFELTPLSRATEYYYELNATDLGGLTSSVSGTFETTGYSADFDGDGDVDLHDLSAIVEMFRMEAPQGSPADLYDLADDDIINIVDITLVINSFTGVI